MAVCFRSPNHDGPFYPCTVCGRTVCHACVGRVLPSGGGIRCIECEVVARRLDPDRWKHPAYRPDVTLTTGPSSGRRVSAGGFGRFAGSILHGLAAPFRTTWSLYPRRLDARLDVSYTSYRDKLLGIGLFALFVIVLVTFGALYANLNTLPFWRVLLYFIVSSVVGLLVAIYGRYFMDGPLGPTASMVASYFLGTLVAIMGLALLFEL